MAFVCNTARWIDPTPNPDFNPNDVCARSPYYSVESRKMLAGLRDSIDPMMQAQMGICGVNQNLLPATVKTVVGVKYYAIQFIIAGTLDTAVTKDRGATIGSYNAALDGLLIPAGTILYGEFTEVKITVGVVRVMEHPFN